MATTSSGLRPAQKDVEKQRITPHQQQQQQQGLGHVWDSLKRSLNNGQQSLCSKDTKHPITASTRRSVTPTYRSLSRDVDDDNDPGRVRVAIRLRPRNAEDLSDNDFADCVELQPELKRLMLRKNNWSSESYKFDEVFAETASQKRVYEVVAKPVVESVLSGYNGTIMAYGQTGTGKTFTLGRLGKNDASERGVMVRALEDIMSDISIASGTVEISYLQLYMEYIQDLLAPEKKNIPISEDPKTGEVSLPGAIIVKLRDLDHFLEVLQIGEANRHAANPNLNTESSRSHAILMVYIRRSVPGKVDDDTSSPDKRTKGNLPVVRKSKLLVVDLAGSERIDKSGSARTSLITTIGPSSRHHAETTSTIMFGQRAMKIVNVVKLKEEFDYESLCRKLEAEVDHLTAEIDRQQKSRQNEKHGMEKQLRECQDCLYETTKNLSARSEFLEKENTRLKLDNKDILAELISQKDHNNSMQHKIANLEMSELRSKLQEMYQLNQSTINELQSLKAELEDQIQEKETITEELYAVQDKLSAEEKQRKMIENELVKLKKSAPGGDEDEKSYKKGNIRGTAVFRTSASLKKAVPLKETHSVAQRAIVAKICEEVGIQRIIQLLNSKELDVQIHAVKVIANLAAEEVNQENIVQEGGLDALITMLRSSQNATILRVASGAIANLAMKEMIQSPIMSKGGAQLLAKIASKTDDPQALRMVAGALANLCGNEKLHTMLKEDGGIKALLGLVRCGNSDVVAQVARGIANFVKCESRAIVQGYRKGRSFLLEAGALEWLIGNCNNTSVSTRLHVELALCHLAQNEDNAKDFTCSGGLQELQRIATESSREDICNLASKILKSNKMFQDKIRS